MGKIKNWEKRGDGYWRYNSSPIASDEPHIFKREEMNVIINNIPNPKTDPYSQTMREEARTAYMAGYRWRVDMYGKECPNKGYLCNPFKTLKEATHFAVDFMKSHPDGYSYHTNYEYFPSSFTLSAMYGRMGIKQ